MKEVGLTISDILHAPIVDGRPNKRLEKLLTSLELEEKEIIEIVRNLKKEELYRKRLKMVIERIKEYMERNKLNIVFFYNKKSSMIKISIGNVLCIYIGFRSNTQYERYRKIFEKLLPSPSMGSY